jgi:hypothetical protein
MSLISLLVIILVLILVFGLLVTYVVPLLPEPYRKIAMAIVALIVIIWLLSQAGIVTLIPASSF